MKALILTKFDSSWSRSEPFPFSLGGVIDLLEVE